MYHEITDKELGRRRRKHIIMAVVVVAACVAVCLGYFAVRANARTQGAKALKESILSAARQCCAIEGSFPSTLEHLEENYGLTINHDDYIVSYEWFAGNVTPSVVVTAR